MSRVAKAISLSLLLYAAPVVVAGETASAQDVPPQAALCATCHGQEGVPINHDTPVIWGQNEGYLYLQLRDLKSGARKSAIMGPIASALEKPDMQALAAYFAGKKWPNLQQPPAPDNVANAAQTAIGSVGCIGCHLDHFQGDGSTARLAGQWREYLERTMLDFRSGTRGNNPGMSDLMKATSEDSIKALAFYLSGMQIDAYLHQ
jgi:cytochrome c553